MKKTRLAIIILLVLTLLCGIFILASCGGNEHTHNYSNEWSKDGTYHWQACLGCEETRNKSGHEWNTGIITIPPTETSEGVKTYTCNTCGQTRIESVPMLETHEHTFSEAWSYNDTHHWHGATCEHRTEQKDYDEHDWDEGVVTKQPTGTAEGEKTYTCEVCQATKKERIGVVVPKYTVTFFDNDGITVIKTISDVAHGSNVDLPEAPTKEGYIFAGWTGNYTNITSDQYITARYVLDDSTNILAVSSEIATTNTVTVLADIGGTVKTCGFDISIYYDSNILELLSYDADLDLDIIANTQSYNDRIILNFSSATDKTKQRDIIELTFKIKDTTISSTVISIGVTSIVQIEGQFVIDADYSTVDGIIRIVDNE